MPTPANYESYNDVQKLYKRCKVIEFNVQIYQSELGIGGPGCLH